MSKLKKSVWLETRDRKAVEFFADQNTNGSQTAYMEQAIKFYNDMMYTKEHASFLNTEITNMLSAIIKKELASMNNKTNQVLSAGAIQLSIIQQLLADNLEADPADLKVYRQNGVVFLKQNQRLFKLEEIVEE